MHSKITNKKNIFLITIVGLLLVLLATAITPQKTEAASLVNNQFSRGTNWIFLSNYGSGHLLTTPFATVRVFYDLNSPAYQAVARVRIKVQGYCRGAPGAAIPGDSVMRYASETNGNQRQNFSSCDGTLNDPLVTQTFYAEKWEIKRNGDNGTSDNIYTDPAGGGLYPGFGFVDIRVRVTGQTPLAVKVIADNAGGLTTMVESPPDWVNVPFGNRDNVTCFGSCNPFGGEPDLKYATGLWDNLNNAGGTNQFILRFTPPCSQEANKYTYIRWYDADYGQGAQPDPGLGWRLVDNTSGAQIADVSGAALGGNDAFREVRVVIEPNHEYTWIWDNVSGTNGIQIWMPYSEINDTIRQQGGCQNNIPRGSLQLFCSQVGSSTVRLNNAYFPYRGGYIDVVDDTTGATSRFVNISAINPERTAPLDYGFTNNPSRSYTFILYGFRYLQSTGTEVTRGRLGPCPPPVPDTNISSTINCNIIQFTPRWVPASANPIGGSVTLKDSTTGGVLGSPRIFTVAGGTTLRYNPFTDFGDIPIHLSGYRVEIIIQGQTIPNPSPMFSGCISNFTCAPQPDHEIGQGDYPLIFTLAHNTSKMNPIGYTVSISGGPGGVIPTPAPSASPWVFSTSYPANISEVITGTLYYNNVATSISSTCNVTVLRYPYVKVFGSDVVAGGGFGNTCNINGGIFTYARKTASSTIGSGTQLASMSFGDETRGFLSSMVRNGNDPSALSGNGLSLAGLSTIGTGNSETIANALSSVGAPCVQDYFNNTQFTDPSLIDVISNDNDISAAELNSKANGKQTLYTGHPSYTIRGIAGFGKKHTLYFDGDLFIDNDINYSNGAWGNISNIPIFTVVVLGNIYIDNDVKLLDGVYIAQPTIGGGGSLSGGIIYTCDGGAGRHFLQNGANSNYTNCSGGYGQPGPEVSPLVVNGSVIARRVVLNRAVNTLSDSLFQESLDNTKAAEVFNFSPEILLSPPVFRTSSNAGANSLGILPPAL